MRRFFRWLLGTDELESIKLELRAIHLLLANEIERHTPKRHQPIGPIQPVRNK